MFQAFPCLLLQAYICMNKIRPGLHAFKPRIRPCATTCFYNHTAFRFTPVVSRSATLMPVSSFCQSFNSCRVWRCAKECNSLLCILPVVGGGALGCHESFAVARKHHFSQHTYVWVCQWMKLGLRNCSLNAGRGPHQEHMLPLGLTPGEGCQSSRMEGSTMIN